jgi:hypothetical protein
MFHASRFTVPLIGILLALLCLFSAACGTTGKILFDDPRGTVSLQKMSDQSIQATHPITLEPTLLAKILRGVEIQDQEHGIQKYLAGPSASVPVFSDDQIRFLAPLLAEGLRTATPDQFIEYRVRRTYEGSMLESSTTETTAGSVYAYGRLLYVILSQYRYSPTRTNLTTSGDMAYRSRSPVSCCSSRAMPNGPMPSIRRKGESRPTGFSPSIIRCCSMRRRQQQPLGRLRLRWTV